MPRLNRPRNLTSPDTLPQNSPSPPCGGSEHNTTDPWDYGLKRLIPLPRPVGAGILAITVFFLIAFFSNVLLSQISLGTLGITVTIGTFGILAMVLLILFII